MIDTYSAATTTCVPVISLLNNKCDYRTKVTWGPDYVYTVPANTVTSDAATTPPGSIAAATIMSIVGVAGFGYLAFFLWKKQQELNKNASVPTSEADANYTEVKAIEDGAVVPTETASTTLQMA